MATLELARAHLHDNGCKADNADAHWSDAALKKLPQKVANEVVLLMERQGTKKAKALWHMMLNCGLDKQIDHSDDAVLCACTRVLLAKLGEPAVCFGLRVLLNTQPA